MKSRIRVPKLTNPNLVVRLTTDPREIELANALVFRNYVAAGFWENDENKLRTNKFLHTPARWVFVAIEDERLVGTISIVLDSLAGLPSDGAQAEPMQQLRAMGGTLAEVSAFAMDRSDASRHRFVLFLMSYVLQFCFYHTGIDRLVLSCVPTHADFYESVFCFSKVGSPTFYTYTRVVAYLLTMDLTQAHLLLSNKHPTNPVTGESFYRFLLCDPHTCHYFPSNLLVTRSRNANWIEHSVRKVA